MAVMDVRPSTPLPLPVLDRTGNLLVRVRRSVRTVLYLLRTVGLGLLWTAISLFSDSNFFTGKSLVDQNGPEFLSTTMVWNQIMFCGFSIATQSAFLTKQRFIDRPDRPAGYLLCLRRVFKATFVVNTFTSVFPIGVVFALNAAASSSSSCVLRWSFYICSFASLVFTASLTIAVRRIFLETSIAGTERQKKKIFESLSVIPRREGQWKRQSRQFCRVLFQTSPGTLSSLFAAGYVQATSTNLPTSQRDLAIFAVCSIGLKLFDQELIKLVTMKRKITDIRTMFLVVAVPTVLIDTQVRIMLQLANSVVTTVGGSVLMAFVEIGMRTGKMHYLRWKIHRKTRRAYAPILVTPSRVASMITIHPVLETGNPLSETRRQREESVRNFETWKMQLLRFHAAEAYADMAAEYMALASSAMIVAVYADHPKYELRQWRFETSTSNSTDSSRYIILLELQLAIELVVDTVSCVVETANGVNFDELKKYESFLMALFVVIGVMDVQITAIMYLQCE
ncbi:hypothetical protein Poli38472_012801 [Pythium oligandrum]|uniref:Uncharacterized protein n=1 Tax=Pythium oligandrum TaxID=41045 RepID=A0A8K1CF13_PYTOL|nr:hypothetical protein Poli38472_012801 [Pythium oligandrum]|eukprot:TMW61610.1 hypothetical protein Poli38472_012801 [Pythium oligandrum]